MLMSPLTLDRIFYGNIHCGLVYDLLKGGEQGDFLFRKPSKEDKTLISFLWDGKVPIFM